MAGVHLCMCGGDHTLEPALPALTLDWNDIQQEGGLTIYLKQGALTVSRVQQCDTRPWRRCPQRPAPGITHS